MGDSQNDALRLESEPSRGACGVQRPPAWPGLKRALHSGIGVVAAVLYLCALGRSLKLID